MTYVVTNYQHGFVSKKLCFTNLLTNLEGWTAETDSGCGIDIITVKPSIQCPMAYWKVKRIYIV